VIAVGIDVGKRTHEACFLAADGQPVGRPLRFASTAAGVRLLEERLAALPEPAAVALEASGRYWLGLQRRLAAGGRAVVVVNPLQVGAFRETGVRKAKTDRRDAFVLADLVRIGRARPNYVPDDLILELRDLTRFRWGLVDQLGDAKRRVLGVLDRVFPEFADQFRDPFGASARALLARAAAAAEFAEIPLDELTALLEAASRKRFGADKARALRRTAEDSLGVAALGRAARLELDQLLAQIALLEAQVADADAAVAELLARTGQHLTSIPGVGPVLAATILAEVGDVDRFARPSALVAYAGIDPSVFASGQFQGTRSRISKRGSPYLRRALYLAAHSGHPRDPELGAYLAKKLGEGKPYKAAVVATARKLLGRIYVVLKEGRPYEVREPEEPTGRAGQGRAAAERTLDARVRPPTLTRRPPAQPEDPPSGERPRPAPPRDDHGHRITAAGGLDMS
jgi:transposase